MPSLGIKAPEGRAAPGVALRGTWHSPWAGGLQVVCGSCSAPVPLSIDFFTPNLGMFALEDVVAAAVVEGPVE